MDRTERDTEAVTTQEGADAPFVVAYESSFASVFTMRTSALLRQIPAFGVLLFLFVLFFMVTTPEDIARKAVGEKAPPAALKQWIVNHGYDKPAFWNPAAPADTLIVEHFRRALTFDFGRSDADDVPIARRLREGVGPSLALAAPLFALEILVAITFALLVALFRGT